MSRNKLFVAVLCIMALSFFVVGCSSTMLYPGEGQKLHQETKEKAETQACQANIRSITSALQVYRTSEGTYPAALQELVDQGCLEKIPICSKSSASGKQYIYDSSTGKATCPNGHSSSTSP